MGDRLGEQTQQTYGLRSTSHERGRVLGAKKPRDRSREEGDVYIMGKAQRPGCVVSGQ